jgi:hypothetical protein
MMILNKASAAEKSLRYYERIWMDTAISEEAREAMIATLAAGGFPSLEAAAWEVSLTVALAKISSYERECEHFRRKYGTSLDTFRDTVDSMTQNEDFTMEDDLADWEFAAQALQVWHKRVTVLRHATV